MWISKKEYHSLLRIKATHEVTLHSVKDARDIYASIASKLKDCRALHMANELNLILSIGRINE